MDVEMLATIPQPVGDEEFNPAAVLPYGLTIEHVAAAMRDFLDFLGFVNQHLATKRIPRLETMLMPANFSSIVGEFMSAGISKYCPTLAKNQHHNGHPDLVPIGRFPRDAVQHSPEGPRSRPAAICEGGRATTPRTSG